ncbi:helix-turn-helix transcriptional regulator [Catenulispora sp. NF23]|uniref:Helix-turn-helix transcriptional regulator n=1 Tax=Catenulispora pinistramenti TaxID=2705254 RepID=A0ABS5KXN6_9ACTN|nr:helix-turn-helix transcriptional regulator [Catenulispora pinistramenti]MBS2534251.1 helix-turn-helix transcriptional regulator [Catenulispora pinistramenti]MBS2550821.1 helix-turn-helix transcriptional regulator [Catenulispora pinistramenti]
MRYIEIGFVVLAITGVARARVHHWRAGHRADLGAPMPLIVDAEALATYDGIRHELRSARKEAGLFQGEAAKLLSIGQTRLSGWETGSQEPSVNQLSGWAEQFRRRLVILDHNGQPWPELARRQPG